MRSPRATRICKRESGAALLIAIFALLLISVVAIALVVSAGTDNALAGNYRTSASAYYAALAGLEEARGRLYGNNPNYINKTVSNFVPTPYGPPLPLTNVLYIINPAGSETVAPTDLSNPATNPDTEYQNEFGGPPPTSATQINSVSPVPSSPALPGQSFKWVRINAVTESALGLDVNSDGSTDPTTLLYFDPARTDTFGNPRPSLIVPAAQPTPPTTAVQALEITSLAVLPNGSRRMLQYVVAPAIASPRFVASGSTLDLSFPAALTLAGNNANFQGPGTSSFYINGQDQCAGSTQMVTAIGTVNGALSSSSLTNINDDPSNYPGGPPRVGGPPPPPTTPSFGDVSSLVRPDWQTPSGLDAVVQNITKGADVVLSGPVNGNTGLTPLAMSASNPITVVVNGDLDLTSWHGVGYGILLVTGTLKYDPDATWEGLVLVIGQGQFISTKAGTGGIDGAVFIAQTRDIAGNLLSTLGPATFSQGAAGPNSGRGIYYNSCLVRSAQGPLTYKVLSFREIPLTN